MRITPGTISCLLSNVVLVTILSACAGQGAAPVVDRDANTTSNQKTITSTSSQKTSATTAKTRVPTASTQGFHVVKKGETLYSIAWKYGFDFRDIADWNRIAEPYVIYPDQVVRLKPATQPRPARANVVQPGPVVDKQAIKQPGPVVQKDAAPATTKTETPIAAKPVEQKVEVKKTSAPKPVHKPANGKIVAWQWPVKGKIIKSKSLTSKKGVDIAGRLGQDVNAAAAGDVVYSGSGLLGYGRLIIIKHNETYLSAYAHNQELLVNEGDSVKAGQAIAKMGTNNNGQPQLHFEIRKNGKSINPLTLLPKS